MTEHKKRGQRHRGRRPHKPKTAGPRREHVEELHPTADPPDIESFAEWDLDPEVLRAIRNMDIEVPTPIQRLAIGPVLEGKDVIAKAETGTGKTLAFGAPLVSRIDPERATVLALVLCPTRELAQQVCDVIAALSLPRGIRVAFVVGGDPMHPQIAALQAGAQIVVGTPGRVLDLYEQRFLKFPWGECVVLDEADKMFEIGFLDDVKKILSFFPEERQTLLFSATFPTEVLKLARSETTDPIEVATQRGTATVSSIEQRYLEVDERDRPLILTRLLEQSDPKDVFLVFLDRRTEVDRLLRRLERLPFSIKALHGGYDQPSRYRVMSAFRTGEVKALLATDVASRGLDVEHVTHVVNYGVPREVEDYTHRIGRTGRAGRTGTAITFVTPEDRRRWSRLEGRAKFDIEEMDQPGRGRARSGRGDSRDGEPRRSRPEEGGEQGRPRRDDESPRRGRGGDDERPRRRRERGGAEEGHRPRREGGDDERPRRGRDGERKKQGRPEKRGEDRPRRDKEKPAFGTIEDPGKREKPERKRARPRKERPVEKRENRPSPKEGGFGAGI